MRPKSHPPSSPRGKVRRWRGFERPPTLHRIRSDWPTSERRTTAARRVETGKGIGIAVSGIGIGAKESATGTRGNGDPAAAVGVRVGPKRRAPVHPRHSRLLLGIRQQQQQQRRTLFPPLKVPQLVPEAAVIPSISRSLRQKESEPQSCPPKWRGSATLGGPSPSGLLVQTGPLQSAQHEPLRRTAQDQENARARRWQRQ